MFVPIRRKDRFVKNKGLEFFFCPLRRIITIPHTVMLWDNINDQHRLQFKEADLSILFVTRVQKIGEPSLRIYDNTDVHSFQPQKIMDYRWAEIIHLEQVRGKSNHAVLQKDDNLPQFLKCVCLLQGRVLLIRRTLRRAMAEFCMDRSNAG
ncbi:hypothetical protein Tco_0180554 [Tanacetum coccineum]